jgi:hypothetical protein
VGGYAQFVIVGVFLSYRREDAAPYARLLQVQLSERLPDARVFMDLDSIEAALDFAEVIRKAVDSCASGRRSPMSRDTRGSTIQMTSCASRSRERFSAVYG